MVNAALERRRRHTSGQALVEFALGSLVLVALLMGAIEFGLLYSDKLALSEAARAAARWAAANPTAWTSSASPASATIEGQAVAAGQRAALQNSDADLAITYLDPSGGSLAGCGRWSASSDSFVPAPGYTEASCVSGGHLVKVTVTEAFPFISRQFSAPFGPSVTESASAAMVVMG